MPERSPRRRRQKFCLRSELWKLVVALWKLVVALWNKMSRDCNASLYADPPLTPMTWEIGTSGLHINGLRYAYPRGYDGAWLAKMCNDLLDVIEGSGRKMTVIAYAIEIPIATSLADYGVITRRDLERSKQEGNQLWLRVKLPDFYAQLVICDHSDQDFRQFWIREGDSEKLIIVRSGEVLREKLAKKSA